jgi:phage terminase large subunit GpA-like protein
MNWQVFENLWHMAWKPPAKLTPSQWAEAHFRIPRGSGAEPGKFRMNRTPYLSGIVNSILEPSVEEIVIVAGTQIGKTTAQEILLGFWIDIDPGPALVVKPNEVSSEDLIRERIRPLLEECPTLKAHVSPRPSDNTLAQIKLDSMALFFGWAGSPQSLASRPCRYILIDEADKFPAFSGRESDPISLAQERTATYLHRRRTIKASTPTTRDGAIWKAWESCGDRRHFHVPCPQCGEFQPLAFAQLKWPKLDIPDKIKRADEIERAGLCWYECSNPACKGRIEESHKPKMLEAGLWVSEGQSVQPDGTLTGNQPRNKRIGFHLSSLYSPWRRFAEMAAEFIRAEGDVAATMAFRNSRLAEPFEVQISKPEASLIREKATNGPPPKIIPSWARWLIASADTQKDHFYFVVRAWGYEYRSQLIDFGIVSTFDELRYRTIEGIFSMADGRHAHPSMLLIDSGGGRNADTGASRTNEVYQFALSDPARIKPIKGASGSLNFLVDKSLQKAHGLVLWNIDTFQCKNLLNRLIRDPDQSRWQVHNGVNEDYCQQMASEHLVIDPRTKRQEWKQKTGGAANHYWDVENYQCAAAFEVGAASMEPVTPPPPQTTRPKQQKMENPYLGDLMDNWRS